LISIAAKRKHFALVSVFNFEYLIFQPNVELVARQRHLPADAVEQINAVIIKIDGICAGQFYARLPSMKSDFSKQRHPFADINFADGGGVKRSVATKFPRPLNGPRAGILLRGRCGIDAYR